MTAGLLKRTRVQALPLRPILWSLVALAHAPGLIGAWRSFTSGGFVGEDLRGCVLPTLSMLFFALKVCDVRFLRFHTDLRSCIALGLVVALLHVNVIHANDDPTLISEYTTLVGSLRNALDDPESSRRHAAMETLVTLGDAQSTQPLIAKLEDDDATTADLARAALVALTRQDFGSVAKDWITWWQRNRDRNRGCRKPRLYRATMPQEFRRFQRFENRVQ